MNITLNSLIQAYAPTSAATDEEKDRFYEDLAEAMKNTKKDIQILSGDLNAKIGPEETEVTGKYGLGEQKEQQRK